MVHRRMKKIIQKWEHDDNIFFLLRVSQGDIVLCRGTQDLCLHTVDLFMVSSQVVHWSQDAVLLILSLFTGLGVSLWLYLSYLYWFILKVTSLWAVLHASLHYCQWQLTFFYFLFANGTEPNMTAYALHVDFSIEVCAVLHFFFIPLPHNFSFCLSIHSV